MIHAYKEHYLDDAIRNLGEAFDFAHTVGRLELDNFFAMFVNSGIAELFGSGRAKYVAGLSGTELAGRSGVKLRTIQQYEMRAKNINKAAAETLQQLAQVLLCSIEDLLEYDC